MITVWVWSAAASCAYELPVITCRYHSRPPQRDQQRGHHRVQHREAQPGRRDHRSPPVRLVPIRRPARRPKTVRWPNDWPVPPGGRGCAPGRTWLAATEPRRHAPCPNAPRPARLPEPRSLAAVPRPGRHAPGEQAAQRPVTAPRAAAEPQRHGSLPGAGRGPHRPAGPAPRSAPARQPRPGPATAAAPQAAAVPAAADRPQVAAAARLAAPGPQPQVDRAGRRDAAAGCRTRPPDAVPPRSARAGRRAVRPVPLSRTTARTVPSSPAAAARAARAAAG